MKIHFHDVACIAAIAAMAYAFWAGHKPGDSTALPIFMIVVIAACVFWPIKSRGN